MSAVAAPPRPERRPWAASPVVALGVSALAAAALGGLAAAISPLAAAAGLLGLLLLVAVGRWPTLGLFLFVLVVATLPFGVVPVRVGVQLTFVDGVLLATYAAFALRLLSQPAPGPGGQPRRAPWLGAAGWWLLAFVAVAVLAYLLGSGSTGVSAEGARRFAKLLASLLFFLVAVRLIGPSRRVLVGLARALMLGGAAAGALAAGLWLLPPPTQLNLLLRLAPLGYPTGDVLRYEPAPNGTYTDQLRAVGTAVDPNVLGGTVMLAAALIVLQLFAARERLLPRPLLLLLLLPTLAGLVLSFSRASWVGLVAGVLFVGRRDRRVWAAGAAGAALLLALPIGQRVLERFVGGFSAVDPATALRLGEYRNAATLIQRYPLLGIGFGPSPDIDVTAGVSSVYLLVGEQTGLLGLAVYLAALAAVLLAGLRAVARARAVGDRLLEGLALGGLAAFTGALVAGLADHYFANQAFPHAVALFWLYAAMLVAAERQSTRATQVTPALAPPGAGEAPPAPSPPRSTARLPLPGPA